MNPRVPQPGAGIAQDRSPLGDFSPSDTKAVFTALLEDFRASMAGWSFVRVITEEAVSPANAAQHGLDRSQTNYSAADEHPTDPVRGYNPAHTEPPHPYAATGLSPALSNLVARVYSGLHVEDAEYPRFIELLTLARRTDLLTKYRVNHLSYNIYDDHYANAGMPSALRPEVRPVATDRRWRFLDRAIGFPIGVAASGLTTNSVAVTRLLRSGYNVVTYKTVRSRRHAPLAPPNWILSNDLTPDAVGLAREGKPLAVTLADTSIETALANPRVSTANSFGVPSADPDVWCDDLRAAVDAAADDQLVICSVLGEDYSRTSDRAALIADFVAVARRAQSTRVPAIEMNLSCPNTLTDDGAPAAPLCSDGALAAEIVREVRLALGPETKLGVKLSYLPSHELTTLLDNIAGDIDFVAGINTVQATIHIADGLAFGDREVGGLGGHVLSDLAVEFVAIVDRHRRDRAHTYSIIGIGGVTDVASFERLYEAGADVVQAVSGVFVNTFLALDCVRELGATLTIAPHARLQSRLLRLTRSTPTPLWLYAASVDQPLSLTVRALDLLVQDGLLDRIDTDNDKAPQFALPASRRGLAQPGAASRARRAE